VVPCWLGAQDIEDLKQYFNRYLFTESWDESEGRRPSIDDSFTRLVRRQAHTPSSFESLKYRMCEMTWITQLTWTYIALDIKETTIKEMFDKQQLPLKANNPARERRYFQYAIHALQPRLFVVIHDSTMLNL